MLLIVIIQYFIVSDAVTTRKKSSRSVTTGTNSSCFQTKAVQASIQHSSSKDGPNSWAIQDIYVSILDFFNIAQHSKVISIKDNHHTFTARSTPM